VATTESHPTHRSKLWFYFLVLSVLVICFNRTIVPNIKVDWLNVIPLVATLYAAYCVVALDKTCGFIPYIHRTLTDTQGINKTRGGFLLSHWMRSCVLMLLAVMAAEFGLRCLSYQRSLAYERHGDLLFTPSPNQMYMEKISLTYSTINNYGLRGGAVNINTARQIVLCLGDSITYGYGVDDAHTYPARLQEELDRKYPGRYLVLNGGVDAYPVAFEWQKFLYLWSQGIHPDIVIVGYTMNEGFLGHLVDSSEDVKSQFAKRVWMKNYLRSFALYNLIAENWARRYYDRMKGKLVPGTNFASLSREELDKRYDGYLSRFLIDLQSRKVRPIFLLVASLDDRAGIYDTKGPFQERFADFAINNNIPLFRTDELLRAGDAGSTVLPRYFLDDVHMNERGTDKLGVQLADLLPKAVETEPVSLAKSEQRDGTQLKLNSKQGGTR
jgi:lysophospholipase L1-like esterase